MTALPVLVAGEAAAFLEAVDIPPEVDVRILTGDEDVPEGPYAGILPVLTRRIGARELDRLPALRVVANMAVGYDNIDVAAARARDVRVTNTPDVLTGATAELAWALILAVARRVGEGERLVRSGGWTGWQPTQLLGTGLDGKVLGIVGAGRIGREVGRRAGAFGMGVAYWGRTRREAWERETGAEWVADLGDLAEHADVLSVHVASTPETERIVDGPVLDRMRPGSILVNTARGDVVDEPALVERLLGVIVVGYVLYTVANPRPPQLDSHRWAYGLGLASGVLTGAYNIGDDLPASGSEVTEHASRLLGVEPPPLETLEEANLSEMARGFYMENRRVANGKAKRVLGWRPQYPTYVEGLENIFRTQQAVAQNYFADGSIEDACPPLKALLTIMAKGDAYQGNPIMGVYVDDALIRRVEVANSRDDGYQTYRIDLGDEQVDRKIAIRFENDLYDRGVGDRNLWIDQIEYNGTVAQCEDAILDMVWGTRTGSETLWSNGEAVFDAALLGLDQSA